MATPILDQRPLPPRAAARAAMLQPEDVAAAILFVATRPHRVTIDELWITPTVQRDRTPDEAPRVAEERSQDHLELHWVGRNPAKRDVRVCS